MAKGTIRLTMAQALVRALAAQWTEVDGEPVRLFRESGPSSVMAMCRVSERRFIQRVTRCRRCAPITSKQWRTRRLPSRRRPVAAV